MLVAQKNNIEPFDASTWRIGIVTASFNSHITDSLKASALSRATDYQILKDNINELLVAGAIEIPLVLQQLAKTGEYDVLLAIGCVIRGDTPHFDYVCEYVTQGLLRVQLDHAMPIGFGVLTCDDEAQALTRSRLGADHLDAVMQQAKLLKDLE